MVTDNRRKEGQPEAKTKELRESLIPPLNSTMDTETGRGTSILPSVHAEYIATIDNALDDCNIEKATKAVKSNKGSPGIDGITKQQIAEVMRKEWPQVKRAILEGKYRPKPVRRVAIPKPDGKGIRQLGIPTVLDRIIQQALHQELVPVFDPIFSQHSFGFRPNRSAQQAVEQVQRARKERAPIWQICRRLQHLCEIRESRKTGNGLSGAISNQEAQTQGESSKKCNGQAMESQIPRIYLYRKERPKPHRNPRKPNQALQG